MIAPLPPGSVAAVLAPAGPATPEQVAAIPPLYARFGLQVRLYPSCFASTGYLAGADELRLADLHAALADDTVAAVHCMRGGYGSMRLLVGIDADLLRAKPKLLIGYSDITALHALWCLNGLPSLHAPMPASDLVKPGPEANADADALFVFLRQGLMAGQVIEPTLEPGALRVPGHAEGRVVGGNLSLVAALLGTAWAWPAGGLLFLEDVNEEPYRVDRLLTQLRLAGVLDAAAGFVLGSFTAPTAPDGVLNDMLLPLCRRQGKPLLGGWPAGHGTPNRPLPLGVRARLDVPEAGGGSLSLLAAESGPCPPNPNPSPDPKLKSRP
ncbi:MAG: LD-carboxypeptidase [Chitinophagaceae bacterium]|nr:LD-carboxypeptidase [Rubrivivax sp.]